jgi:hypothetical protein
MKREDYLICHLSTWDYGITGLFGKSHPRKKKIEQRLVPQQHQPHNGTRTRDINISMSIANLIRLTNQFCFLDSKDAQKQFHHSKAIAILMLPAKGGGCHACGGLTSQTLLYTLACIGLIPILVTIWGELA